MLRSLLGAAAVAAAVTLVPPPGAASAAPARDQFETLAVHPEWGSITGHDGKLRKGCRTYTYSYAITPPEGIWALEVVISGPGLQSLGGGAFLDGYDPKVGTGSYTLCRNTTRRGWFTIRAKLSVDQDGKIIEGQLPPDRFKLGKRRR